MNIFSKVEFLTLSIILWPILSSIILFNSPKKVYITLFSNITCNILSILNMFLIYNNITYDIVTINILGLQFIWDYLSINFVSLINILWLISTIYTVNYSNANSYNNHRNMLIYINICISLAITSSISNSLIQLFSAYELLTLCSLPLIYMQNIYESYTATNQYLKTLLLTSTLFMLPGIAILEIADNNLNLQLFALIILIFGTAKIAIIPFSGWLPKAMIAHTPVSAVLHAVAVVKTGAIFIIRIVHNFIGYENIIKIYTEHNTLYTFILIFICFNILIASIKAILSNKIKKILAYSTIAQLSYITFAALIPSKYSFKTAIILLLAHSIAKITLFFGNGIFSALYHVKYLSDLRGKAYKHPIISSCIVISVMSLWGVTFLSGNLAKFRLFNDLQHLQYQFTWMFYIFTIFSVIYLSKIIVYLFMPSMNEEVKYNSSFKVIYMNISIILLVILNVMMVNYIT